MTPRSHVTKREAQAVVDFAIDVLELLHMPGWQILVMDEPADEDDTASIGTVEGKYTAQLYLASDWMKRTDEDRCETVVHEVLHLLHFRVNHVVDDARDLMHGHEHDQLKARYWRETELMVDHLAKFLSRTHTLADPAEICEAEWAFDVDFDVMCSEAPLHVGDHRAVVEGNGGVAATVTWPQDPTVVRGDVLAPRPPARPAPLPDPVIRQREN